MHPALLPSRTALVVAAWFLGLTLASADPASAIAKARELTQARKFQAAITELDRAIAETPTSAEAFVERGRVFAEMGKTDRPLEDFDEALRLKPDYAEAWFEHGKVRARKGEHQKAIADFTKALRFKPDDIQTLLQRGISFLERDKDVEAKKDLSKVIALDPKMGEAWYQRSRAVGSPRNLSAALKDADEAVRLDPNQPRWVYQRGQLFMWMKDFPRAIADFTEAMRLEPTRQHYYNDRAHVYWQQGKYELAIADLTEAIRLKPELPFFRRNRAGNYLDLGKLDLAMADINEAIRLNKNAADYFLQRAKIFEKMGQRGDALSDLAHARKLGKGEPYKLYDCGNLLREMGEGALALEAYNESIAADAGFGFAYVNRAKVLETLGRTEEAHADRLTAAKVEPHNAYARNALGVEFHKKREYERAIEEYTLALAADPKFDHAIYNRFLSNCALGNLDSGAADAARYLAVHGWGGEQAMYCSLVRSIVTRRGEGDGPAKTLLSEAAAKCDREQWPHPILLHLNGELSLDELLRLSDNAEKMTESRGYIGLMLSAAGQREQALPHLRWVRDEGKKTLTEYLLTMAELKRLKE